MKDLSKTILSHLDFSLNNQAILELSHYILQEFPQYTFSGKAYRAVILFPNEVFNQNRINNPGQSWALSEFGRLSYIKSESQTFKDETIVLIDDEIIGVNLSYFIQKELPEVSKSIPNYLQEEEIICTEVVSIYNISSPINAIDFK